MIDIKNVTILILIDGFLQYGSRIFDLFKIKVTILILIDGFLQYYGVRCSLPMGQSQSLF